MGIGGEYGHGFLHVTDSLELCKETCVGGLLRKKKMRPERSWSSENGGGTEHGTENA